MAASLPSDAPPRTCGDCTLCCKVMAVETLDKPAGRWCAQCDIGEGCKIYETRPQQCDDFNCQWLINPRIGAAWRPADSRMVLHYEAFANRMIVHVDDARPDAWRKAPFEAQMRNWAAQCMARGGQCIVMHGMRSMAIFPRGEKDLGVIGPEQVLVTLTQRTPMGPRYDVVVMDRAEAQRRGLVVARRPDTEG
ncbi:MAG: hypothetical protein SGJ23_05260 [Alphaproteobacteria bacterium]|nr:hypothetical protein [Alphaproteobacteria bacterium]